MPARTPADEDAHADGHTDDRAPGDAGGRAPEARVRTRARVAGTRLRESRVLAAARVVITCGLALAGVAAGVAYTALAAYVSVLVLDRVAHALASGRELGVVADVCVQAFEHGYERVVLRAPVDALAHVGIHVPAWAHPYIPLAGASASAYMVVRFLDKTELQPIPVIPLPMIVENGRGEEDG